jgi:hypothetical protein
MKTFLRAAQAAALLVAVFIFVVCGKKEDWMKKISSGKWHLIFNKKTGIWGHEHPAADDFAEVPLTMSANQQPVEQFTIEVTANNENSGTLKAMWGTSILSADFIVSAGAM